MRLFDREPSMSSVPFEYYFYHRHKLFPYGNLSTYRQSTHRKTIISSVIAQFTPELRGCWLWHLDVQTMFFSRPSPQSFWRHTFSLHYNSLQQHYHQTGRRFVRQFWHTSYLSLPSDTGDLEMSRPVTRYRGKPV